MSGKVLHYQHLPTSYKEGERTEEEKEGRRGDAKGTIVYRMGTMEWGFMYTP